MKKDTSFVPHPHLLEKKMDDRTHGILMQAAHTLGGNTYRSALANLLSAADEILCTLDKPEGWELGWQEARELENAADAAREVLKSNT